jgi:hypothetical protein
MTTQIVQAPARRRSWHPAIGIALYLWMRGRRVLLSVSGLLIVSTLADHWLTSGRASEMSGAGDFAHMMAMVLIPCLFLLMPFFAIAALDEGLWVLPVRTKTLVGWLTIYGALAAALFWIIDAACVWRPAGLDIPIWWPAAALAAIQTTLFAVRCQPLGPSLRQATLYVLSGPALAAVGGIASALGAAPGAMATIYLALVPVAYAAAAAGAQRSRQGDRRSAPDGGVAAKAKLIHTRFRSEHHAQSWLEARPVGFVLAWLILYTGALTLPILGTAGSPEISVIGLLTHGGRYVSANLWAELAPTIFGSVLVTFAFALGLGTGFGVRTGAGFDAASGLADKVTPYFGEYPIGAAVRVAAKLRFAATTSLTACAALLPFALLWWLLPAWEGGRREYLGAALWSTLGAHAVPIAAVCLVLPPLLVWKLQTETLFLTMTRRPWIFVAAMTVILLPIYVLPVYGAALDFSQRVLEQPANRPYIEAVLALAVLAKLSICAYLAAVMRRRRILSASELRRTLAVWAVTAGALFVLIGAAFAPEYLTWRQAGLAALLIMPGVRVALAPLAATWGRVR